MKESVALGKYSFDETHLHTLQTPQGWIEKQSVSRSIGGVWGRHVPSGAWGSAPQKERLQREVARRSYKKRVISCPYGERHQDG